MTVGCHCPPCLSCLTVCVAVRIRFQHVIYGSCQPSAPQSHYAFNLSPNFRLTMDAAQAIQITAGVPDLQNDTARDKDRVTCRLYLLFRPFVRFFTYSSSRRTVRCRRQFAKYTCPTCNIPYCSLTCFRSQVGGLAVR